MATGAVMPVNAKAILTETKTRTALTQPHSRKILEEANCKDRVLMLTLVMEISGVMLM